jgi:hypothetical protein
MTIRLFVEWINRMNREIEQRKISRSIIKFYIYDIKLTQSNINFTHLIIFHNLVIESIIAKIRRFKNEKT